jgi:hypothetical protein
MSASNLDQICDDLREKLSSCSDRLRVAATGNGAFADAPGVYLEITITISVQEAVQRHMRRFVLKGTPCRKTQIFSLMRYANG